MISTRDLSRLPDIDRLRRVFQSMAMLDAILVPEWQYRSYSFNSAWSLAQCMGSMRDGSGDFLFIVFTDAGAWIKGFDHESPMSRHPWPGVLDAVPFEFADCLSEPAFTEDATFCLWRLHSDVEWKRGEIDFPSDDPNADGSEALLSPLDGEPETYRAWAEDYYEIPVDAAAVRSIFAHMSLTDDIVSVLNPGLTLADLKLDIAEIDYR